MRSVLVVQSHVVHSVLVVQSLSEKAIFRKGMLYLVRRRTCVYKMCVYIFLSW